FLADGNGSIVSLPQLTSLQDISGGSITGSNRFSTLTVSNNGTIQAPALTTLLGVHISIDASGSLVVPKLASATVSQLDVDTQTVSFANLTNVDGSNVFVSGGATLTFPLLTSYTNLASLNSQYRTLQASGPGSVLDLSAVTSVTNGT